MAEMGFKNGLNTKIVGRFCLKMHTVLSKVANNIPANESSTEYNVKTLSCWFTHNIHTVTTFVKTQKRTPATWKHEKIPIYSKISELHTSKEQNVCFRYLEVSAHQSYQYIACWLLNMCPLFGRARYAGFTVYSCWKLKKCLLLGSVRYGSFLHIQNL